jgi:hypothetical protein
METIDCKKIFQEKIYRSISILSLRSTMIANIDDRITYNTRKVKLYSVRPRSDAEAGTEENQNSPSSMRMKSDLSKVN